MSTLGQNLTLALTLGKIETLSAHFFETLERRAFTEHQVSKIHEFEGFLNTKFVYFIQMYTVLCLNS